MRMGQRGFMIVRFRKVKKGTGENDFRDGDLYTFVSSDLEFFLLEF